MANRGSSFLTPVAASIPYDNSTDSWVANNVQTAIEEAPIHLRGGDVSLSSTYTLTTSDVLVNGLTISPAAGTYLMNFTGDVTSAVSGAAISISLYVGGIQVGVSLRKTIPFSGGALTSGNARGMVGTNKVVTITTGQAIEIRGSVSSTGPTVNSGTLTYLRLT